jgi:DinB superfamily
MAGKINYSYYIFLTSTGIINKAQTMNFTIEKSIEILERTPGVLTVMLQDISADWASTNEGPGTWSAYDIIGHLIHGEKTDWIPRAEIILSDSADKAFKLFDRFAQFEESKGKSLKQLLDAFTLLRKKNIEYLRSKKITIKNLEATGIHPAFGEVTLSQLLSTWVVHDLNHIAQISRVMAKQYKEAVGPWTAYLKILQ